MGKKSNSVFTPIFRVAWPSVFELKVNEMPGQVSNGTKKPETWLTALFPEKREAMPKQLQAHWKPLDELKKLAMEAAKEKWGADTKKWPKFKNATFRDQSELRKEGQETLPDGCIEGAKFIRLKSRQIPGIIDQKRRPIVDGEKFYAGCWAHASVSAMAYSMLGNCGVSFWMNNIQLVADDEPLSGRRRAEDEFEEIPMEEAEPNILGAEEKGGEEIDDLLG